MCPSERCAAICVNRVDLPIPGSPPSSIREPGTIPPPSTVSNSDIPELMRVYLSYCICERGFALGSVYSAFFAAEEGESLLTASSAMVLNFPQEGHLPSQRGETAPHSAHTKTVFVLLAIM